MCIFDMIIMVCIVYMFTSVLDVDWMLALKVVI